MFLEILDVTFQEMVRSLFRNRFYLFPNLVTWKKIITKRKKKEGKGRGEKSTGGGCTGFILLVGIGRKALLVTSLANHNLKLGKLHWFPDL
jgi:hypothetical protein